MVYQDLISKKYSFKSTKVKCLLYSFCVYRMPRNSCWEVFCKKGVLKKFTDSQENTCVGVAASIKLRKNKKRLRHRCFLVNFCEILKNTFFK